MRPSHLVPAYLSETYFSAVWGRCYVLSPYSVKIKERKRESNKSVEVVCSVSVCVFVCVCVCVCVQCTVLRGVLFPTAYIGLAVHSFGYSDEVLNQNHLETVHAYKKYARLTTASCVTY